MGLEAIGLVIVGAFLGGSIVRVVMRAPPAEELWPQPLDPAARAIVAERVMRIRCGMKP